MARSDRLAQGADGKHRGEDDRPGIDIYGNNSFLRHDPLLMNMSTSVTQGIRVSVHTHYEARQSDPNAARWIFSYRIRIENTSAGAVKLLRRQWFIWDSLGVPRRVEGPGVVGETPVLGSGEVFTYSSFCDLKSSVGRMHGSYLMQRADGSTFHVRIPAFHLHWPWLRN